MNNKLLQPESKFFELIKQNPTPTEEEWAHICKEIQLSESTIRLYTDEVNWCCVSQYQYLSKDFIRENGKRLWLNLIEYYQDVTDQFIKEMYISRNLVHLLNADRRVESNVDYE